MLLVQRGKSRPGRLLFFFMEEAHCVGCGWSKKEQVAVVRRWGNAWHVAFWSSQGNQVRWLPNGIKASAVVVGAAVGGG